MQVEGKILEIFETVNVKDGFQKREFVIEYAENPSYPEFLKFEAIQDRCAILDRFSVGDAVKVDFNLKGRKWTNREGKVVYFNSLQAWNVNASEGQSGGSQSPPPPQMGDESMIPDNELPF